MDELVVFYAPKLLGDAESIFRLSGLTARPHDRRGQLRFLSVEPMGEDLMVVARPAV